MMTVRIFLTELSARPIQAYAHSYSSRPVGTESQTQSPPVIPLNGMTAGIRIPTARILRIAPVMFAGLSEFIPRATKRNDEF